MKSLALFLLLAILVSGCSTGYPPRTEVTPDMLLGERYVGLIRNNTDFAISVPSDNSAAAIIVPPQGQTEYVIWTKETNLEGYLDGRRVFCSRITARPKAYTHMCQAYDFVAEIYLPGESLTEVAPPPGFRPDRFRGGALPRL